jgi:hypothetical protein
MFAAEVFYLQLDLMMRSISMSRAEVDFDELIVSATFTFVRVVSAQFSG